MTLLTSNSNETEQSFGQRINQARKGKGYSQRDLAKLAGIDFTYLSKLENNRADYPPKEAVIRNFAEHLNLDAEQLIFLAGRIPARYNELLKQNYKAMPVLFRRMQKSAEFAERVFKEATQEDQT